MRVLFISYNGALEPLIQSQGIPYLKGLSQKGVKAVLLSFENPRERKDIYNERAKKLKAELKKDGIGWHRLRYHKSPTLPATLFDVFMGIILGLYLTLINRIGIIHARSTVPAAIGFVISRLTFRKFIFDERGLMAEEYVDGGIWKNGSFLYKLVLYFEKKFLTSANAVVVLSENIREYLLNSNYLRWQKGNKKAITVIPCCVDTRIFNPSPLNRHNLKKKYKLQGKFTFLYSGSLGTWYMFEEMVDFLCAAKKIINNLHFLLLTRTPKNTIRDCWLSKGMPINDITIASVEFGRMPDYIKLADAGMFFIKPVFSKRSSCPTKFAEYLACGLPVVINRGIGDTDRIIEKWNAGVVIGRFEEESYIKAALDILEMSKDKTGIANKCQGVIADCLSLEKGIDKYWQVYKSVINP